MSWEVEEKQSDYIKPEDEARNKLLETDIEENNSSTEEVTETQPIVENQNTETQQNSTNPAWDDILNLIPESDREKVIPKLSEWDKNFQEVQQKQAPYKEFIDLGVPAEDINEALQYVHLFKNDPKGVYDYLNQQYGTQSQGQKAEEEEDETLDLGNQGYDLEKDPRYQEMNNKLQFFEQHFSQQQQKEIEAQANQQITSEFSEAEKAHGTFDDETRADVIQLALGKAQMTGKDPDIRAAADEYFTRFKPKTRASDSAPPVVSGNRALPVTKTNPADMSREDRVKFLSGAMDAITNQ